MSNIHVQYLVRGRALEPGDIVRITPAGGAPWEATLVEDADALPPLRLWARSTDGARARLSELAGRADVEVIG